MRTSLRISLLSVLLLTLCLAPSAFAEPACFLAGSTTGVVAPDLTAVSCDSLPEGYAWRQVADAPYDLLVASPYEDTTTCVQLTYAGELSDGPVVVEEGTTAPGCAGAPLVYRSTPYSGYGLWLKADTEVTVNVSNVTHWADQSASGNDATQTAASAQPKLLLGAVNGLPAIRFDGAQSLNMDTPFGANSFTIFVVGKHRRTSGISMIFGPGGSGAPNHQLRWEGTSSILYVGVDNNIPATTVNIGGNTAFHLLTLHYNGSTMSVYKNGVLQGTRSFSSTGPWNLNRIGAWFSSYYMIGDLAEVLFYDSALGLVPRGSTENYLIAKYNL